MEVNYINMLSEEMLLLVFSFVGESVSTCEHKISYDLLNLFAVCKKWKLILEGSGAIMKRLPLRFKGDFDYDGFKSAHDIKRKYQSMILDDMFITVDNNTEMFQILRHAKHVRELKIMNCNFDFPIHLKNIFEHMPHLEKIYLKNVSIDEESFVGIDQIQFRNLVKLEIIVCSTSVINFFQGDESKIKHFCLDLETRLVEDLDPICKFLSKQTKLQDFSSLGDGFAYNNSLAMSIFQNCPYRLKKLSFSPSPFFLELCPDTELTESNMLEFLKTQAESVEQLVLFRTMSVPIFQYIFMNFKNLKSIHFQMNLFPVEEIETIFKCRPIYGLKDLILSGNLNYDSCKGIFSVFPNVEKLVINNTEPIDNNIMFLMSKMLLKVDSLHISTVDDGMFTQECKFVALKTLQIQDIENLSHIGLSTLTKCNPFIESLSIKYMDSEFHLNFDMIASNLKNLIVLKLGRGFYPTLKVAEDINNKCYNLRILKMADYFANDNQITCVCLKDKKLCSMTTNCNICHNYTLSKYSSTEAETFNISGHIDHNKIMLVTFNLTKLSLESEFAVDNILENGKYYDHEKEDRSIDDLVLELEKNNEGAEDCTFFEYPALFEITENLCDYDM